MKEKTAKPIDILIVGAGMYVCGKGTTGYGTILPAVFEAYREGLVGTIHIAAQSRKGAMNAEDRAGELKKLLGVDPPVRVYPESRDSGEAYLSAFEGREKPAAAIIAVPDQLHFEVAHELIKRQVHVQVVKPLVPTAAEARALIDLKNNHGVYGCVEFHKRFDEANLKLYEVIRSGVMGDLVNFRINYSQRKCIPVEMFCQWVDATNIFQYLGVHYVDLIHFLTGARPLRVMSIGAKKFLVKKGLDNYDTIQTEIEWQEEGGNRFVSSHLTSWIDPESTSAMSDQRLEVIGTKGRYRSDQRDRGVRLVTDDAQLEEINPYFTQVYPDVDGAAKTVQGYGPKSIIQFIRDASHVIAGRKQVEDLKGLRATFESSLPVAAVLEASAASLLNDNRWVDVEGLG